MYRIPFFKTTVTGKENHTVQAFLNDTDGAVAHQQHTACVSWMQAHHNLKNFFFTKSCTQALELAALVIGIKPGDEVIMPSYAFVSCANAFAIRGASCVFVDISPETMNLDVARIEEAITSKTKAIVTLNYAGISPDYFALRKLADTYNLLIIEDNAHGIDSKWENFNAGSFGDIACFSYDHLKNVTCYQGGGITFNNESLLQNVYIPYEFGTNRNAFFKGNASRYEWSGLGSNFALSALNIAFLSGQLPSTVEICNQFRGHWEMYYRQLESLQQSEKIDLPVVPANTRHNGHCFYLKLHDKEQRDRFIQYLATKGIQAQFHYSPLHSSSYGKQVSRFVGRDLYTTKESNRLVRLPLFYSLTESEAADVIESIYDFFNGH